MSTFHTQRVSFSGSLGHRLTGRLECPESEPVAYAVFAHCFTCSKDYIAATRVSRALARRGVAVLRFDFTGLGDSAGDFAATSFSSNIADVECAAAFLRESYLAPQLLIGHSLGGAAVLAAADRIPETRVVATIAAPSEPAHVIHHFAHRIEQIEREHEAEVDIAGRPFRISKQFLDDIGQFDMETAIAGLSKALLVFHSPEDNVVDIRHAERIFSRAAYPKSFTVLDGADHLLTRAEDAELVADTILAWVARYIASRPRRDDSERRDIDGAVIVSETKSGRYAQRIFAGRHVLHADEPRTLGGDDSGPSPYDLQLASLRFMYGDHPPHVRAAQAACATARRGASAAYKNSRAGLRRLRDQRRPHRSNRACDQAGWRSQRDAARETTGDRGQVPGASNLARRGKNYDTLQRVGQKVPSEYGTRKWR